jgi:hypothetical protein
MAKGGLAFKKAGQQGEFRSHGVATDGRFPPKSAPWPRGAIPCSKGARHIAWCIGPAASAPSPLRGSGQHKRCGSLRLPYGWGRSCAVLGGSSLCSSAHRHIGPTASAPSPLRGSGQRERCGSLHLLLLPHGWGPCAVLGRASLCISVRRCIGSTAGAPSPLRGSGQRKRCGSLHLLLLPHG